MDPENSAAMLGIAEIQLVVGNYDHARNGFKLVAASTEHRPQGLQGTGIALLADAKYDMAGEVLQQAVTEDSTLWRAWTALGQIYDFRRDWENARRSHDAAVEANNRSMIVHNNRGISLLLQGLYSDAASAFTHALTISPDMKNSGIARANLRIALAWQGQYMEALSGLRDYETPVALNNIGYIAMLRGDYEEAEAYLTRAVDNNPRFYDIASQNLKRLENLRAPPTEQTSASN
jgi:Flp pilus assembly protein TadD